MSHPREDAWHWIEEVPERIEIAETEDLAKVLAYRLVELDQRISDLRTIVLRLLNREQVRP